MFDVAEVSHGRNAGLAVFRVGQEARGLVPVLGGVAGLALAGLTAQLLGPPALAFIILCPLAAYVLKKPKLIDRCSEPDCQTFLTAELSLCPGCGGTISGRIKHADQRLAAREALEEGEGEAEDDEEEAEEA